MTSPFEAGMEYDEDDEDDAPEEELPMELPLTMENVERILDELRP